MNLPGMPARLGVLILHLLEKQFSVPLVPGNQGLIEHLEKALSFQLKENEIPIRLVIAGIDDGKYLCEVGCLVDADLPKAPSIFSFARHPRSAGENFNTVFIVPTGVGAEVGGHAGDATPAAQLLASCCNQLITHPNVVNASDVNEIPANAHYVEGSVLCRFLMGTVGLSPVRANRLAVVFDAQSDAMIENLVLNTVESARTTYGLECTGLYRLDPPLELTAKTSKSGRAIGEGRQLESLFALLVEKADEFDAVAISSLIGVPTGLHDQYFRSEGTMINPWGGIEAMLTHAVSHCFNIPSAHAPMMESREILNEDPGRVDPRMAAEAISSSFLQCVLKGLKRSPRIVSDSNKMTTSGVLTARDISCLVIPEGCIGLPILAALEQGITVIAVREGSGLIAQELETLPWADHQFYRAENYWEAAGILSALRAGISPASVRRPLGRQAVETWPTQETANEKKVL
ncbi:MAG: DUF3326 domain-containing protein [Alphaproteobacteria bacterium]